MIRYVPKRKKWFAPSCDFTTKLFRLAVRRRVGDKYICGERGDDAIAIRAGGGRDARMFCVKGREEQQTFFLQWRAVFLQNLSRAEIPRETKNDGLFAAQENPQTFAFHRRMETANDGNVCVAQFYREVVGFEDEIAGAAIAAKEGERFFREQVEITNANELFGRGASEKGFERTRIARVGAAERKQV